MSEEKKIGLPDVVSVSGIRGSGKTLLCKFLAKCGYFHYAMADPAKSLCKEIGLPWSSLYGSQQDKERVDEKSGRCGRDDVIDVCKTMAKVSKSSTQGHYLSFNLQEVVKEKGKVVVDGPRMPEDFEALKHLGAFRIYVKRDKKEETSEKFDNHITEKHMQTESYDLVLVNKGDNFDFLYELNVRFRLNSSCSSIVILKPDALGRGIDNDVIARIRRKDFYIRELCKSRTLTKMEVEKLYSHVRQCVTSDQYEEICYFMQSGPVRLFHVGGIHARSVLRRMVGHLKPCQADVGTIRFDFGSMQSHFNSFKDEEVGNSMSYFKGVSPDNVIHASSVDACWKDFNIFASYFSDWDQKWTDNE